MSVHPLWVHPVGRPAPRAARLPGRRGPTPRRRPDHGRAPGRARGARPGRRGQAARPAGARAARRRAAGAGHRGARAGSGTSSGTARDVAATGLAVPVVLCGRNDRLRARVAASGHAVALGWVDDVPASVLGASTSWSRTPAGSRPWRRWPPGCPMLSYRCIAGHGETNARALDAAGLVPWARSRLELSPLLAALLVAGRRPGAPVTGSPPRRRRRAVLLPADGVRARPGRPAAVRLRRLRRVISRGPTAG